MRDQRVHHAARERRVGDDAIGRAVMVERKRVLPGADVAGIGAAHAEGFQMPDQCAVAAAWFGKTADSAKVRDQRQHRCPRRRVKIRLTSRKTRTLTHLLLSYSGCATRTRSFPQRAIFPASSALLSRPGLCPFGSGLS